MQNPSAAVIFRLAQALHVDPRVLMQAAGYEDSGDHGQRCDEYEVTVDPELLRFLARFPREQQTHFLKVMQAIEKKTPVVGSGRSS